jgi:hypothetical protein
MEYILVVHRAEEIIAIGLPFVWLGLVVGISFIETPLKFRAPGITTPLALGIGRLVFRALNVTELVLACVLAAILVARAPDWPLVLVVIVLAIVLVQTLWLRPSLDARARRLIAGGELPSSSLHLLYIAFEGVKVIALPTLGAALAARWLA